MELAIRNLNNVVKETDFLLPYIFTENKNLLTENASLKERLESSEKINNLLREQIRLSNQRQFGKKSETSNQLGLPLFDENEQEEQPQEEIKTEKISYTRRKKAVGRKIDTSKLPREQIIHDITEEEKRCEHCGKELEKIGEERSEQLEHIPAQLKVIEHIKLKYTCRCCGTIKTGKKPESPLPKSMAGSSLIAEVIIKKYEHHLPWYRQSKIFAHEGIDIPPNTIGNWFMQSGLILLPLKQALWQEINKIDVLQADETTVKVLDKNIKGYMWAYNSCVPTNRFILFEYNDSRKGEVVNKSLENYRGILQTDGYSGYNKLRNKEEVISVGCWAHCRRKFIDVIKLSSKTGTAHEIVGLIRKLYQIEDEARKSKLDFNDRKELRQTAKPILEKIHTCLIKAHPPPDSALGRAIKYGLNQWEYLTKYINYGQVEIDNNWVENQIRPFALGRKNWLFTGNELAAQNAAFFYSLIQTCRLNNIDPRKYLIYVLNKAGAMRRKEIDPKILLPQFIDKNLLE